MYNTIVLSGGAVKGITLLGALHHFYVKYDMTQVNTFIGTSVGAMISYLLALGLTPLDIMSHFIKHSILSKFTSKLLSGQNAITILIDTLKSMSPDPSITLLECREVLGKTLIFATYNKTKEQVEYLNYQTHPNLCCIDAVHMSANLPLLFPSFQYNDCEYCDGGVGDNFPIQLTDVHDNVLGIYLKPQHPRSAILTEYLNPVMNLYDLLFIPIHQLSKYKIDEYKHKHSIYEVNIDGDSFMFNLNAVEQLNLFSKGYESIVSPLT